jgi:cytochrome b
LLAAGFFGALMIAEFTDDEGGFFALHMILGLLVGLMTVLRIVWGVVGSRYARFREFTVHPKRLFDYFKDLFTPKGERYVGHNPATSFAALSIFVAVLGLVASGGLMALGRGDDLKELHEVFAFGMLAVVGLHVIGVMLHTFRHRDQIVLSMLDGKKSVAPEFAIPSSHLGASIVALLSLSVAAVWLLSGYDPRTGRVNLPGTSVSFGTESDETSSQPHEKKRSSETHEEE